MAEGGEVTVTVSVAHDRRGDEGDPRYARQEPEDDPLQHCSVLVTVAVIMSLVLVLLAQTKSALIRN